MLRRNRELVLALLAILLISGLYVTVVSNLNIPQAKSFFGHSIGILGSVLMVMTETLYSLRKRVLHRPWGRMNEWLRFHIFTGIVGPYLILLHTAWSFRGLAGAVMLMTLLVVLSGFIGRYIYTAVPRTEDGGEVELEAVEARLEAARQELMDLAGEGAVSFLEDPEEIKADAKMVFGRAPTYWSWRLKGWLANRALQPDAREKAKKVDLLAHHVRELQRQRHSLVIVRRLLSLWHTFHVPLGMALFTAALFHIGAALYYATFLK